jgi:YVTN family beta-propeller protein
MKPFIFLLLLPLSCFAQRPDAIMLPNGWQISAAGTSRPLGDLPLNLLISSKGKYMAVLNCGQSVQTIQLFDPSDAKLLDSIVIPKTWYGMAFSQDEQQLYVSGGNDNIIWKYSILNNKLQINDSIRLGKPWPKKISPAGMSLDDAHQMLYVVTKESNQLLCVDLREKSVVKKLDLGGEGYACLLSPDTKNLYISCWGCDKIKIFNTVSQSFTTDIAVGDNPNELLLTKNGKYLYVCNANDNTVSVIDTYTSKVIETLDAAVYPNSLTGSTTNGIALNERTHTLYIANADNNCLAVFDVSKPGNSKSKGFIPVGWYPTNVKCYKNQIYVTNGKGFSSFPNAHGPNPLNKKEKVIVDMGDTSQPKTVQYIANMFKGTLSCITMPGEKLLKEYTTAVYRNTPYNKQKEFSAEGMAGSPIPTNTEQKSPIKYVFYIIKENRTYDQVLGDIKQGNGDTSLVLFGNMITPNQHKLATDLVLLDNFYVNAEVSADGHNWSMGAYATDYLEKNWPTQYGGRGGSSGGSGRLAIANNKKGFIWDACAAEGVTFRTYGEFVNKKGANIAVLKNSMCRYFDGFNLQIKDTTRYYQWQRDFDSLLAINAVPQLSTIRFGNDHTEGMKKGRINPLAHVADNDLAVGLFIQHLASSSIWKESAVFILEDDAQNGADHVDAHRSTAYVAGGFVKRGYTDHTLYTSTSMLRTMELILGVPPMTQYDAASTPMWRCFDTVPHSYSFTSLLPAVDLNLRNTAVNQWQRISEQFNLAKEDANEDIRFNTVLWHAIKGDVPFPAPKRAAFVRENGKAD